MATRIKCLTEKQAILLKDAFGYESYPSGAHGHTRQAVEWLKDNGFEYEVIWIGTESTEAMIDVGSVYFTKSQIKDLTSRPLRKWRR